MSCVCCFCLLFFFKQKTAYEMRISDWSSDVCSSDLARDDGAHGGTDPPAVVYTYMPGRGKVWAEKLLGDFTGIVQCDGYGAYKHIEAPDRKGGPGTLAFCWAHVRRGFFDDAKGGNAPVAEEALRRIASLYRIEARSEEHTSELQSLMHTS